MTVVSMMVGATTPDGATFVAKVTTGPVRVAVADNAGMTSPVFTSSQAVDAQGVAKVSITGRAPSTRYWYRVEDDGVLDTSITGQFVTHPPLGSHASFTLGFAGDAGLSPTTPGVDGGELAQHRVSNHAVFDLIRTRALAEGWLAFGHLGDMHYYDLGSGNHGITGGGSLENYRTSYDDVLLQPRQHQLYREVPLTYVWDDHDYGPNDSDGTHAGKANAGAAYRERVPHYPLAGTGAIYHSFQIGRVLFIVSDTRFDRTPNAVPDSPGKTMLGSAQKSWMATQLDTTSAEFLVWVLPSQWMGVSTDSYARFTFERAELINMFDALGWRHRMCIVSADIHELGIDTGGNSPGGIPVFHFASMDASFGSAHNRYDTGTSQPGRNQYGTIQVADTGTDIVVTGTGWIGEDVWESHAVGVSVPLPLLVATEPLLRSLTGSHRPTFEARVLSTFQTGPDPDGVEIPVLGGDVIYDGTAEVFASLDLQTVGHDGKRSLFPRRADALLAPYGNEVFVRRGVDMGSEILWIPLGYFRLDTTEQGPSSSHPIRLACQDRMSGIVDARMVQPRQFLAEDSVATVVNSLVRDVYPDAVVLFDDASGLQPLNRQLIVEEDRYAALLDVVESLGKVMFFDGEGFLRIMDAPEPDNITWDLKAGRNGVLVTSARVVSRADMANGVVARGEGATKDPVVALAVDAGPNSPTRWGGRFGRVPRFYSSPLLTDENQARKAAESVLRRHIGMPYNVSFGSIPHPALRPRDVVRITQQDGNRERHLIQTCRVPLVADAMMTGTTREQALIRIEQLVVKPSSGVLIEEGT